MTLLICLLGTWPLAAATINGYDEAYDERGAVRPAYRKFAEEHQRHVLRPSSRVSDFMLDAPLNDSSKALPVPLILSSAEQDYLRAAVAQRARVFRWFFHDLVMGEQRIFAARDHAFRVHVEALFRRAGMSLLFLRQAYAGKDLRSVRFLYAPDLVREPGGRWVVLEDNVGQVPGGTADADVLRENYARVANLNLARYDRVGEFIGQFVAGTVGTNNLTEALLPLAVTKHLDVRDDEGHRLERAVRRSGVSVEILAPSKEFEYVPTERTFAMVNLLPLHKVTAPPSMVHIARGIAEGKLELFETLGIEALSNKSLLPLLPGLAQFYLGEDLLLESPAAVNVATAEELMGAFTQLGSNVVFKAVASEAGQHVYFWDEMSAHQKAGLMRLIDRTSGYDRMDFGVALPSHVAQAVVTASHLPTGRSRRSPRARIDLRPITYVGPDRIDVAPFFWGRAATAFGNRRQNVSQGALQMVVLPECAAFLTE